MYYFQHGDLPDPDVFVSYCWVNSASAVKVGEAKEREGSLGFGDPRQLKTFLESHGFVSWLDKERAGRVSSTYLCYFIVLFYSHNINKMSTFL